MEERLPDIIYKYFTINEYLYQLLINSEFWFSSPKEFNDPYDCNICLNEKEYTPEEIETFWIGHEFDDAELAELKASPKLIHSRMIGRLKESIDGLGVVCFSKTNKSIPMWSHYANSHKGICIGFDAQILNNHFAEDIQSPMNIIRFVKYVEKFPEINFLSEPNQSYFKVLMTKSTEWEKEEEIRIIKGTNGRFRFPVTAIKEACFELKTPEAQINSIMNLLTHMGLSNVKYWREVINDEKFEVSFDPISKRGLSRIR